MSSKSYGPNSKSCWKMTLTSQKLLFLSWMRMLLNQPIGNNWNLFAGSIVKDQISRIPFLPMKLLGLLGI